MNQNGQAFSAFQLLIGAVLSLAVLAIIVSTIVYFDSLRFQVTSDKLNNGWLSAVNAPSAGIIRVDAVTLVGGSIYTKKQFAEKAKIQPECITFDSGEIGFKMRNDSIEVDQTLQTNVYIQCSSTGDSVCPIECVISFDKPLEPPENS